MKFVILVSLFFINECLFAQQIAQNKYTIYEYNTKYIQSSIAISNKDSSYVYRFWSHGGHALLDSGAWRIKCDMIILNSDKSYDVVTNSKKSIKPKLRPVLFNNSCFNYRGDSIIEERKGRSDVYRKVVN